MHVAVMTMVRNEAEMLPRWLQHYGGQFGLRNLVVVDDLSDDGSTTNLDCTVLHMPVRCGREHLPFAAQKASIASKLAAGLLEMYDYVIFTDVDEFIVADPRRYASLAEYLERNADAEVLAPTGLNLLHIVGTEPALEPDRPLLAQRRHVKFVSRMCKPAIKRVPVRWASGTHGVAQPFTVQRDLYLFHAKFADYDTALKVHAARHSEFRSRGSGRSATWRLDVEDLRSRYQTWTHEARRENVLRTLDSLDLSSAVGQLPNGAYATRGGQLRAMDERPLLRLPDDIGAVV